MAREYKTYVMKPRLVDGSGAVTICENLRPMADGSLGAAYPPGVMMECVKAWKFLGFSILSDGGSVTVMQSGRELGVKRDDYVMQVATLPSEARCINFEGDDVVISTDEGICRLWRTVDPETHDDTWHCSMPSGEYPGLHFTTIDRGEVSAPTGGVTFAKPYETWGGTLAAADLKSISSALKEAYLRAVRTIADAGDFTQPVAVRYKLRDRHGRLLHTGPVTVVAAQGGWQGMDAMTASVHTDSSGPFVSVDSVNLTMRRYTLAIDLPGNRVTCDAPTDGVYAEVYVLPQLHPLDVATNAEYRMSATPGEEALTVWLPGATLGRSPLTARLTRTMASAPAYMDENEVKIATIQHPFALKTRRVELPIPDTCAELHREASDDNTAWKRMTFTAATDNELAGMRLTAPHSFSAGCVCRSGRNVVWGCLKRMPFMGYDLNALSIGDASSAVRRASIRITLCGADGKTMQVVRNMDDSASDGLILASDALSSMIMYPDPSATLMEVRIERQDGSVAETSITLVPSPDRRCALSLSPSMTPRIMTDTDGAFTPFNAENNNDEKPSMIGVADSADSSRILAAMDCCPGVISRIIPAWGANASWDYGAGRFYVMTSSGIYGLAADCTAVARMKATLIDPRSAIFSHCAVMTPRGVAALAGGDLLLLSGTRSRTLLRRITASAIGYSGKHDELWLFDTFGATIYPLQYESGTYRRPDINIRSMLQAGTELMMIDDTGRMLISSTEDPLSEVRIRWEGETAHPVAATAWLTIDMECDDMAATVTLRSHQRDISRLKIRGSVHHLTGLRILSPPRSRHQLLIEGTVRGHFTMRGATLHSTPLIGSQ